MTAVNILTTRGINVLFGLALVIAGLLYLPGINGPWLHDDEGRIVSNEQVTLDREELDWQALARSTLNYPERPLAMMSYAVAHALCGDSTACQKGPNILLHLLTGLVLFILLNTLVRQARTRRLFDAPAWLPLAVAALWLLHPLNVSTTLYVVQRMTILATLFSLLALLAWLHARDARDGLLRIGWLLAVALSTLLGSLCKETAWLVPLYILLIELLLLKPEIRQRLPRPLWAGAGLALAAIAALALLAWYPPQTLLNTYATREFTPPERLLTESRILLYYVSEILFPLQERMSFLLDVFPLSRSLLDPPVTLAAVLACVTAIVASTAILLQRASLAAFGCLLFFVGHVPESSSAYGLILAYEHRNYLPMIGLLLAVVSLLAQLTGLLRLNLKWLPVALLVPALVFSTLQLRERATAWGSDEGMIALLEQPRWARSSSALTEVAGYYQKLELENHDNSLLRLVYGRRAEHYYLLAARETTQNFVPLANLLARSNPALVGNEVWQMMEQAAAHAVPDNRATNAVNWMVTCTLSPGCPIDRQRLATTLELFLANPKATPTARMLFRRAAGSYYVRVYGDTSRGLALAREAAASGDPQARESLVKNLAFAGQLEEARAAYAGMERDGVLDPYIQARIEAALVHGAAARR